jgi:DNA-binding XRE family transcriptional regulator
MSVATKKPTMTDYVEVRFRIPADRLVEAQQVVYPDFNGSVALRGARKREALTQKELAHLVGISQVHIPEMENGKRPIGKDLAKRLAQALKVNYRVFL